MPTLKPRIVVTIDEEIEEILKFLAKKKGVSVSKKAQELIGKAILLEEDLILSQFADLRRAESDNTFLNHEDVW